MFPPAEQHAALLKFGEVCGTHIGRLGRDASGNWAISGKRGQVYAGPEGYCLVVSKSAWAEARERLLFGEIARDRVISLNRLPDQDEAAAIRIALGISHRHQFRRESEEVS